MDLRRASVLISLLLLAACGADAGGRPADYRGPIAEAPRTEVDLGPLFAGARLEAVFVIENAGAGELVIRGAKASCGCTKPAFERTVLPPGEATRMTVAVEAPPFGGPMRKRILVTTNDRYAETLEFTIAMEALGAARLSRSSFEFADRPIGREGLRERIELELPPGHALTGVRADYEVPSVRLEVAGPAALDLVVARPWQPFVLREYLSFSLVTRTTVGGERLLQPPGLQLSGRIRPEEAFEPSVIDFGWVPAKGEELRSLRLPAALAAAGRFEEHPQLRVRATGEPGTFAVLLPAGPPGAVRDLLRFRTGDGAILPLPVLAVRSAAP